MMEDKNYGLIILASGISRRFGQQDKLLAPFRGQALAVHTAELAINTRCSTCVCVVRPDCPELAAIYTSRDIDIIVNEHPEDGQGRSLALGVAAIADCKCDYTHVVLADMPLVTPAHLEMLRGQIGDHEAAIAYDGKRRSPPALFRQSMFQRLIDQQGDAGARNILRASQSVKNVAMPACDLVDLDTPEDLKRLEAGNID